MIATITITGDESLLTFETDVLPRAGELIEWPKAPDGTVAYPSVVGGRAMWRVERIDYRVEGTGAEPRLGAFIVVTETEP